MFIFHTKSILRANIVPYFGGIMFGAENFKAKQPLEPL